VKIESPLEMLFLVTLIFEVKLLTKDTYWHLQMTASFGYIVEIPLISAKSKIVVAVKLGLKDINTQLSIFFILAFFVLHIYPHLFFSRYRPAAGMLNVSIF